MLENYLNSNKENIMKVWSLGDVVVDLLPLENMQYQACAGGAPANVAVGLAKLGCKSGFIGRFGDDPFGHFMQKTLVEQKVDCQFLEWDSQHHTSTVVVNLSQQGERSFTFLVNPSADQFLSARILPQFEQDILHFCSLALVGDESRQTVGEAIKRLKQTNGVISFDVNLREQMWSDPQMMHKIIMQYSVMADILKLSDEELFWLTGVSPDNWSQALDKVANYPAKLIIVTKGANGSIVLWDKKRYDYPAYQLKSVDTTGAGDAFMSGLLAHIASHGLPINNDELTLLISMASACGALVTTQKGAMAALPSNQQLLAFIQKHGKLTIS